MKERVAEILSKELKLEKEKILALLETPKDSKLGDYAFPCFTLAKEFKKNPAEIAKSLAEKIKSKDFEKVEAVGAYLNVFVSRTALAEETLKKIQEDKDKFGSISVGKNQKALIEHTSINPNASPHVGRARNALIGNSIAKILAFAGFSVEVHYFVNDVGKQIALLVLGAGKKNPKFSELLNIYVDINKKLESNPEIEKKAFTLLNLLENRDKKTKKQFKDIVHTCVVGQEKILSLIGINYDSFDYESDYLWSGKVKKILEELKKTGKTFEDSEGRIVLNQEGYNLPLKSPVLVLTRADKTSLYPLRDMAYTMDKLKINPKNNYIVLGEDQKAYFQQIASALDMLKSPCPTPIHYSFVLLKDKKMATREGTVVLLEDFLKEAVAKAKHEIKKREGKADEKRALAVAIAAIKYSILKVSAEKNVAFDLEDALSFEGDTGPYLLYAYARAKSILKKAKYKQGKFKITQLNDSEKNLIFQLSNFKNIVESAYHSLAPNLIANYAFHLAQSFNEFYHANQVIGSENEKLRLALVDSFSQVLKNALSLLGINTIERM